MLYFQTWVSILIGFEITISDSNDKIIKLKLENMICNVMASLCRIVDELNSVFLIQQVKL